MSVKTFVLKVTKPYQKYFIIITCLMFFIALQQNLTSFLLKMIIDSLSGKTSYSTVFLVCCYVINQFGVVPLWFMYDGCNYRINAIKNHITNTFIEKIKLYDISFFQNAFSGDIASKVKDAGDSFIDISYAVFEHFLETALLVLISTVLLCTVHWIFSVILLFWVVIFTSYFLIRSSHIAQMNAEIAESSSKILANIVDFLTNIMGVKSFCGAAFEIKRIKALQKDYNAKVVINGKDLQLLYLKMGIVASLYIVTCLLILLSLYHKGIATLGDFALVFTITFEIVNKLFTVSHVLRGTIREYGTFKQAISVLDFPVVIKDKPDAPGLEIKSESGGEVIFDRVFFHYKGAETLFENKSLIIPAGQKVGLVGYSGSGKSTFVNLILRFYDVTSGAIFIDGQNIQDVTQDSLRSNIGIIPQEALLFHRSLMENIQYGRYDATPPEVVEAAIKAHAHKFILKLPQGYDSLIGERGIKLSGGQRQRIAIARAILKNAPILILDEATSHLDSVTEHDIQKSLEELMKGKTTIVIAHRLSTLRSMDRILVFNRGKIVEDGTSKELLEKGELYKTLWDSQVGGFLPDEETTA